MSTEVERGAECVESTSCMMGADECSRVVDEEAWKELASDATFNKYNRHLLRSFIDLTANLMWCPNPKGCNNVVKYSGTRMDTSCSCGYSFCFACGMEAHSPAACQEYTRWKELSEGLVNKASVQMMMDTFKRCPKCHSFVEKTSGCKHMTCVLLCTVCREQPTSYAVCALQLCLLSVAVCGKLFVCQVARRLTQLLVVLWCVFCSQYCSAMALQLP